MKNTPLSDEKFTTHSEPAAPAQDDYPSENLQTLEEFFENNPGFAKLLSADQEEWISDDEVDSSDEAPDQVYSSDELFDRDDLLLEDNRNNENRSTNHDSADYFGIDEEEEVAKAIKLSLEELKTTNQVFENSTTNHLLHIGEKAAMQSVHFDNDKKRKRDTEEYNVANNRYKFLANSTTISTTTSTTSYTPASVSNQESCANVIENISFDF